MKRIKAMNGYSIFQATTQDARNDKNISEGEYFIYFSSDIKDFGREFSDAEYSGIGSLEEAEQLCAGNYAKAKEIVEATTTAASYKEIRTVEAKLDNARAMSRFLGARLLPRR